MAKRGAPAAIQGLERCLTSGDRRLIRPTPTGLVPPANHIGRERRPGSPHRILQLPAQGPVALEAAVGSKAWPMKPRWDGRAWRSRSPDHGDAAARRRRDFDDATWPDRRLHIDRCHVRIGVLRHGRRHRIRCCRRLTIGAAVVRPRPGPRPRLHRERLVVR